MTVDIKVDSRSTFLLSEGQLWPKVDWHMFCILSGLQETGRDGLCCGMNRFGHFIRKTLLLQFVGEQWETEAVPSSSPLSLVCVCPQSWSWIDIFSLSALELRVYQLNLISTNKNSVKESKTSVYSRCQASPDIYPKCYPIFKYLMFFSVCFSDQRLNKCGHFCSFRDIYVWCQF